jgi:hypothetical protein
MEDGVIYSLTELDDVAQLIATCDGNFPMQELQDIKRKFIAGRYGRDWRFQRWLMEKCGLDRFAVRAISGDLTEDDDEEEGA